MAGAVVAERADGDGGLAVDRAAVVSGAVGGKGRGTDQRRTRERGGFAFLVLSGRADRAAAGRAVSVERVADEIQNVLVVRIAVADRAAVRLCAVVDEARVADLNRDFPVARNMDRAAVV